jgi:hypothetical protein
MNFSSTICVYRIYAIKHHLSAAANQDAFLGGGKWIHGDDDESRESAESRESEHKH